MTVTSLIDHFESCQHRPLEIVAAYLLFIALMDSNVYYYMYKKENTSKKHFRVWRRLEILVATPGLFEIE